LRKCLITFDRCGKGNTINPFDEEKNITQKIMSLKTDSKGIDEPKELEGNLIFTYLQLVGSTETIEKVKDKFVHGGMGYGEAKKILVEEMLNYFRPMRKRYEELTEIELQKILEQGKVQAQKLAQRTMAQVRTKVGIL
jgi:tryptophanyl-tRNA synthetase